VDPREIARPASVPPPPWRRMLLAASVTAIATRPDAVSSNPRPCVMRWASMRAAETWLASPR
jgi:hypothetical protein